MSKLLARLDGEHAPKRDFWESELELGLDHHLAWFNDAGVPRWLERLSSRQVSVLRKVLGLPEKARDRLAGIPQLAAPLVPYFLVTRMAAYKARVAVAEYVEGVLDKEMLELCRETDAYYDVTAAMLALYHSSWKHLPPVFQLHRLHRTGFARMKLKQKVRKKKRGAFREFLRSQGVRRSLAAFDKSRKDGLECELMGVIPRDQRDLVFIRRARRPTYVVMRKQALHGYSPEWIILDFFDEGKRVRIGAKSPDLPGAMASLIATSHFGVKCEYENEIVLTPPGLLTAFLEELQGEQDDDLTIVELTLNNSPISSSPKLRLSSHGRASVSPAINDLQTRYGKVFLQPENIASFKVIYVKKRVSIIPEAMGSQYVVRYSDQRLNGTEREKFEMHLKKRHGIKITSTEKQQTKP